MKKVQNWTEEREWKELWGRKAIIRIDEKRKKGVIRSVNVKIEVMKES